MIKTERQFVCEMRKMIRRVINGENALHNPPTPDDVEVLAECINCGYLLPLDSSNADAVNRTLDGTPHINLNTAVVPLKGLAFLRPDRTRLRANVAIFLSAVAIVVSILSDLTEIVGTIRCLICLLK